MKEGGIERVAKRFETVSTFELVNFEDLDDDEKTAITAAIESQKQSKDEKYRVGAAMRDFDGHMVAIHNEEPGPNGHAEQNALRKLYGMIEPPHERKVKMLAMAGARKGEEVIRKDSPYEDNVELKDVEWMKPCPKCLEYIHDRTANVEDVKILSVAASGQIIRTSLRSLLPLPHTSFQVPLDKNTLAPSKELHETRGPVADYLTEQNGSLRKKVQEIMKRSSENW